MADTVIVYAKTQPDKGSKGITAFIVEKGMPVRCPCSVMVCSCSSEGFYGVPYMRNIH